MPLYDLDASNATEIRKANPLATWGNRALPNRVEPFALPGFDVPFHLRRGEAIFTVGSCFARHVETELLRLGFKVPMCDLFADPAFTGLTTGILNNYGAPSIYNELAWAFGELEFVPADHIVEVAPRKFVDLHLAPSLRPCDWDLAVRRRDGIAAAYRTLSTCRVMIITLGLVEVWFDKQTGCYLNATPRPGLVRANPDRFRLHVLSFEEIQHYLKAALDIARRYGHPELQVLLTVSPVPLTATHRNQDVIVANCYSKSVLRAVAETMCASYDFCHYYPSYESVTLSARHLAWDDDLEHPTKQIVALNVDRMVTAFVEADGNEAALEITASNTARAIEMARKAISEGPKAAEAFFARYGEFSRFSVTFAMEHASFLLSTGQDAEALVALDSAPEASEAEDPTKRAVLVRAAALVRLGRADEALARLDPLATPTTTASAIWDAMMKAALATNDAVKIAGVAARHVAAVPKRAPAIHVSVGHWRQTSGDIPAAIAAFRQAVAADPFHTAARVSLAEALLFLGRADEAKACIADIDAEKASADKLLGRLQRIQAAVEA